MEQVSTNVYRIFGIVSAIIFIVILLLFTIAEWKILKKAGENGWKSLIPFYCVFVSHHIVGMSHVWFVLEIVIWFAELIFEMFDVFPEPVTFTFGIAAGVFTLLSELIHILKMCNCFGKGTGFKIGMIILPNLFLMILAYGKAEYKKPEH